MQTRTVVVIGGGFAGWSLLNHLQQYNLKRAQIILVDNKEYFESTPGLPQFMVHDSNSEIHFTHSTYLTTTQLLCGDVSEVTRDEVVISRHMKGKGVETARIRYDCLIICSGRRYRKVDTEDRSLTARLKFINSQREHIKRADTLLVVGGGPAGVELAAELACKHPEKSVTMMHRGSSLISRTCDLASQYTDTTLRSAKVHIVYKKESNLVDKETVSSSLQLCAPHIYDKVFACIGGVPNSRFMRNHFAGHLDDTGAIRVNQFFQLEGFPHIFAIGDVTALAEEKTAERAMVHGELVAKHVKAYLKRKLLGEQGYVACTKPFMQVIALGPENGVVLLAGNQLTVGADVPKMKREYVKSSYTSLITKLVVNKRYTLYGLISKTPPPAPQTQLVHVEEVLPLVVSSSSSSSSSRPKSGFLCCFNALESEPELTLRSHSAPATPNISPRGEGKGKRRALRSMSTAVGMVDVSDISEPPSELLNPKVLILGADNAIAKLLIEALAHTGMRTRAAVDQHTWITQSASYKLSYSMLIHNVECVDYDSKEEQSLDTLLEGIQIVMLPVGLMDATQLCVLLSKLTKLKTLKCVIYVRPITEDVSLNEIEDMLHAYKLPSIVLRHSITMQTVRDMIWRQVHCFRSIVWPKAAGSMYLLDQKDLCSALVMIFHEPRRHVGKVYHCLGPEALTGSMIAHILSNSAAEDITFIEASDEQIIAYLLTQGLTQSEAQVWLRKICTAEPENTRSTDLDLLIDSRPATFSKWLIHNINSFSDIWTCVAPSSASLVRKSRPRSAALRRSDTPSLYEVLSDKSLSRQFLAFLESEYCAENYFFWQAVERFREMTDVDEMIATAVEISNQYIYEAGSSPINIEQKLRVTILSNMRMCLSKDIFDVAQEKVLRLMEMEAYPRFAKAAGLLSKNRNGMLRVRSAGYVEPVKISTDLI